MEVYLGTWSRNGKTAVYIETLLQVKENKTAISIMPIEGTKDAVVTYALSELAEFANDIEDTATVCCNTEDIDNVVQGIAVLQMEQLLSCRLSVKSSLVANRCIMCTHKAKEAFDKLKEGTAL